MIKENNLMNFEGNDVEIFEFKGKVLFNPKHVADCLEIKDVNSSMRNFNEKQVIKLTNSIMHDMHFRKLHNTGEKFLTESGVYKLIFKSHKEEAEKFQDWVADEVLPAIRQTGGYIPQDENDTDEDILAKAVLIAQKTIDKKNKIIEQQRKEIEYKGNIITGFTDNINLAEKRQILNRVIRQGKDYSKRYGELYTQFNLLYHMNLDRRIESHNEKYHRLSKVERKEQGIKKITSKMQYIDEILNMIPQLYEVAVKLYESDVNKLANKLYSLRN